MEPYNPKLKENSRKLRSNMTDAEQVLWQRLRRKQIHGVQFYRQKPLLAFIVDFYCPSAKLVVELDGGQHFENEHQAKDDVRDALLTELGLCVLRFDNRQVLVETDAVLGVVERVVWERELLIRHLNTTTTVRPEPVEGPSCGASTGSARTVCHE